MKPTPPPLKIQKHDEIGAAGAEEDAELLDEVFVDTGELTLLEDVSDRRHIVLGRTGAGKSALLLMLGVRKDKYAIKLRPESLALTFLSNSTMLSYLTDIGVNPDPFFKLLWRHILTVELLQRYFSIHESPKRKRNLLERIAEMFPGNSREDREGHEAIEHLRKWGSTFWVESEFRVKEITQRLEEDIDRELQAGVGSDFASLTAGGSSSERLSTEQRSEIVRRAQSVVARAQVQDLQKVVDLTDRVLSDKQQPFYVIIDGLDEAWVEDRLRYKLIMALLNTAKDLLIIRNAKVIIALRRDLIERVFRLTRDSGFQEEKFQSLYIKLGWDGDELLQLLDSRVAHLSRKRGGRQDLSYRDLLPSQYKKQAINDFIKERVRTPRDIISFFNVCLAAAPGKQKISTSILTKAEGEYSRGRLRALAAEWSADYPALLEFVKVLSGRPESFVVREVDDNAVAELCLDTVVKYTGTDGQLISAARQVIDCVITPETFRRQLLAVFYRIGIIGLKIVPHESASWMDDVGRGVSSAEIHDGVRIVVHKMYHRALGVR